MFMRKVDTGIELYFAEALVLCRAYTRYYESGGATPLITAISDYLHMLYDKIIEGGGIDIDDEEKYIGNYEAFERTWFCNYVTEDSEGNIILFCDIFDDVILEALGYGKWGDCPDYAAIDILYNSTSDSVSYTIDENGGLHEEDTDRTSGKTLLKKINSEIKHFKKVMKNVTA